MNANQSYRVRIYEFAASNNALITIDQAESLGIPAVELRKLKQRGFLDRVGRGAYRVPFLTQDSAASALEAITIAGNSAYLVGESVLSLLEIGVFNPRKIQIASTKRIRKSLPESISFKSTNQISAKVTKYRNVRCQTVYEAFQQVASSTMADQFTSAIHEAKDKNLISKVEFESLKKLVN